MKSGRVQTNTDHHVSRTAGRLVSLKVGRFIFDFTKTVKQVGDRIFLCASVCQKPSQYRIILQSYCTSKKGAIFYASQCRCKRPLFPPHS